MAKTAAQRILSLASRQQLIRPRDVAALGIARESLLRLYWQGLLVRLARGVYALADGPVTEHHSLAVAAKLVPHGVVCLLSALRFHGLTTQDPHQVWIAIGVKARKPSVTSPSLRIARFSGRALAEGIELREIEGVGVQIYCPAKTVADCFKYRNKIGIDVAMEALRSALRTRKAKVDDIHRFAKTLRVAKVMQPYLESTV
ncbi:MAG: type IV toxin-antitoxin system AbiEi family antitoxin domain-containing protein [Acidobacteria bacterium]|nr:type IV toxin-antitoxin system AbiEi family antitoxin domain-containing protein [Acidobacteriota bacterium]